MAPASEMDMPRHIAFAQRKEEANMSAAELCRRADLSANTLKHYISGKKVRETTVQALHEALEQYIAEQDAVKSGFSDGIHELPGNGRKDPSWHEDHALVSLARAYEHLNQAIEQRIENKLPTDETFLRRLKLELRRFDAFLKPI
ncbi:helix-turn-helix transcriptional regulator [uncultured Roseobacter sp.]|uniref:helix-turn-helix domain-containing protein n=1 Tax=uncultured Roseobacter sp. TaxID=114847 RepID=UPI0026199693|nr:helix-turn-helix transcriptional regulator [uncultured Roseobacter sp.]